MENFIDRKNFMGDLELHYNSNFVLGTLKNMFAPSSVIYPIASIFSFHNFLVWLNGRTLSSQPMNSDLFLFNTYIRFFLRSKKTAKRKTKEVALRDADIISSCS